MDFFGEYFRWYNTEHYHSRIGYVTPEQMHQDLAAGIIAERKRVLGEQQKLRKMYSQQIKQPEAGCSLLEIRFATSSKNHAGYNLKKERGMFSQRAIEKLDYYVYFLEDPDTGDVFYVGKGNGNRVFSHLKCAIETDGGTEKLDTIRKIIDTGKKPRHYILRHGLKEDVAFEIEASLIDFVGRKNLLNLQGGHHSNDYGILTVEEISARYDAEKLSTDIPSILININKLYRREMKEDELYDATRKSWVLGNRKEKAQYAIAAYRGLTREVYKIDRWFEVEVKGRTRWGFDGCRAEKQVRENLNYKSVAKIFTKGAAYPIRYLNC
nr:hypothetical protein [Chlorobium phaeovibrioides]